MPGQKTETIVSDFAVRALKYHLEFPTGPDPKWFTDVVKKRKENKKQSLRTYVRHYFDFPTPGRAIWFIDNTRLKPFLIRWHKEYSFICQYNHVSFGKMMLSALREYKDWRHAEMVDNYGQKVAGRVLFDSLTAAASACALIAEALINTYGAKDEVRDYWKELYTRAFPSKALWKLYVEKALS